MLEKIRKTFQPREARKSSRSREESFHLNTILRLSRKFGAERISKDAAEAISAHLTEEMKTIIQEADKFTRHAGRKTIMTEDIKLVIQRKKQ